MNENSTLVDNSGAAIVCEHVAGLGYPILLAEKDEPAFTEDTGWQFLCNTMEVEDQNQAQVWALSEVVDYEPSLADFVDAPVGTNLVRDSADTPWRASRS